MDIESKLREVFGDKVKTCHVELKYQQDVKDFIDKLNLGQQAVSKSNLIFK